MNKTRNIVVISFLAVIIALTGSFKIPGPFPGTEFQLSAPIAIAIAVTFGFKRYMLAGIVASSITLLIGTHTLTNVLVAFIFRIVVGLIIHIFKPNFLSITIAGPLGSAAARIVLGFLLGTRIPAMLLSGLPGMIYTAIASWPLSTLMKKTVEYSALGETSYEKSSL